MTSIEDLLKSILTLEAKIDELDKKDHAKMTAPKSITKDLTTVERDGNKIILPKSMGYDKAIETLTRKMKEESTEISINETIEAFPLDGAHALMHVLQDMFGWAQAVPTPGFFGPNPPTLVNLQTGPNTHTQVIWGRFLVPGIEKGNLQTGGTFHNGKPCFVINGTILQKDKHIVKEIADKVREKIKTISVYKAKAIKLKTKADGTLDIGMGPEFIDLSKVNEDELVFSDTVMEHIRTNLFTPVEKTEECRKHGVPLKRGVLLEGKYGTGKTLTAYVTAKKCTDNGWTFIYLDRVSGLKGAMLFAQLYGPAVIFAEDIDRVVQGERTVAVDDVLNQIDGIESKNSELITILTTNYVDKIEKAMMRPGRLDAVISVHAPDAKAAEKLVRIYARGLVSSDEDLTPAGKELENQIPAVIREVVERSKLFAISRLKDGETLKLTAPDLVHAAQAMKRHLELMEGIKPKDLSIEEKLGKAMGAVVLDGISGGMKQLTQLTPKIDETHERVRRHLS